jgi:4-hydroxy-tetrahydrodipicolinate reductase
MEPLRVAIVGATGRTGSAVLRLAARDSALRVVAALAAADDPRIGRDAGAALGLDPLGVLVAETCDARPDVLIDFSAPASCMQWLAWCVRNDCAFVSGTTGLEAEQRAQLEQAARAIAVLWARNMSVGVNLLVQLVSAAAAQLGAGWDIEITETHHRHKVDAPSGTALALYEAACAALDRDPATTAVPGRSGQCGPRTSTEIGVHALRMGGIVGEHSVHFATPDEQVTLEHRAFSRDTFAAGAIRAAKWIDDRPPGLYCLRDVLAAR